MKEKKMNESYFVGNDVDSDNLEDAEEFTTYIHTDDVLIMHNHGVGNNLYSKDIVHVVEKFFKKHDKT